MYVFMYLIISDNTTVSCLKIIIFDINIVCTQLRLKNCLILSIYLLTTYYFKKIYKQASMNYKFKIKIKFYYINYIYKLMLYKKTNIM